MRPHILVVDDSDEVRLLASRILEREGYQVTAADSGASALDLLQKYTEFKTDMKADQFYTNEFVPESV